MKKTKDIASYVSGINLEGQDPLAFLIEDNIHTNPYHKYVVRKIISQLEVKDHIHNLGPALQTNDEKAIFTQIINGQTPTFMKKMIQLSASRENTLDALDERGQPMLPAMQLLETDDANIQEKKLKKPSILDAIRAKFVKPKPIDEVQLYGQKSRKMVECYYVLPQKIQEKQQELEGTSNRKQRKEIKKELRELEHRKTEYRDSILKWYYSVNSTQKPAQVQQNWQTYYEANEPGLIEWIGRSAQMLPEYYSEEEKIGTLQSTCEQYFFSKESFDSRVEVLRRDIEGNLELMKTVFGRDYREAGLLDILQELRDAMDDKLLPRGMTGFRNQNLQVGIGDHFFARSSKANTVQPDMQELATQYEEMKQIEDQDQYVDGAIAIFQRFIEIHPYLDGNGRTSRALLDIMLLNRDIVPPVLYNTYYDRSLVDQMSMEYLAKGNKEALQIYIKEKIGMAHSAGTEETTRTKPDQEMER